MPQASKSLIAVNLHGTINTSKPVRDTLTELRLDRRFTATVVPDTPGFRGMLRKAQGYIAWCSAKPLLVEHLLKKRGRFLAKKGDGETKVTDLGFSNIKEFAKALSDGSAVLGKMEGVSKVFRLAPPRGGFKRSSRRMYSQGGILGENPDLPKILEAMM